MLPCSQDNGPGKIGGRENYRVNSVGVVVKRGWCSCFVGNSQHRQSVLIDPRV